MSLKVEKLQYSISNRTVIHPFTYTFHQENIYAVTGLNGSGKTTFLKLLCGIWEKSSGRILWNEQDIIALERRERSKLMTFVPSNPHIFFDYTVRDIVTMGGYASGPINLNNLVEQALSTVGITHLQDRLITKISSGERQRTYIARALVTQSPILVLDEPTSSLDSKQLAAIWNLLEQLRNQGKLIIIATHDTNNSAIFSDENLHLENGYCNPTLLTS